MISVLTLGAISIWSVTSVSGTVTYFCTPNRRRIRRVSLASNQLLFIPSPKSATTTSTTTTVHEDEDVAPRYFQDRMSDIESLDVSEDFDLVFDKFIADINFSSLTLYKIQTTIDGIHIYNASSNTELYTLTKGLKSKDKLWNHDYVVCTPRAKIAAIYTARIGNGGYVETFQRERFVKQNHTVSLYESVRLKFDTTYDTFDMSPPLESPKKQVPSQKVFVLSKLSKVYEFKLGDATFKWNPTVGHLQKFDRSGNCKDVASILIPPQTGGKEYFVDVIDNEIDPVIALCTSVFIKK